MRPPAGPAILLGADGGFHMPQFVRVDENLWASAVAPEGVLEWWFTSDGAKVVAGQRLAEVQIEGACHEVVAPAAGELRVMAFAGSILDPGSVIGRVIAS
jgi:hypothetical protein